MFARQFFLFSLPMPQQVKKYLVPLIYFALAAGALLVFWQVRNFDFVNYDDNEYVYENLNIINGLSYNSFICAFTTPHVGNWLPLTWLSFMLDCQMFGPNSGWMHLENLLLHLANTLLLFAILKKMTGSLWPCAFVAAAFALHPMHVESVAWITERKDVLSTSLRSVTHATDSTCIGWRAKAAATNALGQSEPVILFRTAKSSRVFARCTSRFTKCIQPGVGPNN
jgi:hypothetical protein